MRWRIRQLICSTIILCQDVCKIVSTDVSFETALQGVQETQEEEGFRMETTEVKKLILEKVVNNKIPCRVAFEIAETAGWQKLQIGELLNEMDIKISSCQLGCFK